MKQMNNSDNKTKTMWRIINAKIGKKNNSKTKFKNIKLKVKNNIIEDPTIVANTFNKFYATIGE